METQPQRIEVPKALANLGNQAKEVVRKMLQLRLDTPGEVPHVVEALRVLRIIPAAERHIVATTVPFLRPDTLRRHTGELQLNVDLQILLPYLLSDELLTLDEQFALTNQTVPYTERIANLVLWVLRKGPQAPTRLLQCLRRSVIEHPRAAAGHAFVDELLSKASCSTEQMINDDRQTRQHQQVDITKSVKFAKLVREAWKELHLNDVEDLKAFISALDESLVSDKEVIESAKNASEILTRSNNKNWNYRDTTLFTIIVEEYCTQDSELVKKLQQYNEELEEEKLAIAENSKATQNTEPGTSYFLPLLSIIKTS